jgi:hypothetical protein
VGSASSSSARGAVASEAQFKKLSFAIRAGTGDMVAWTEIQKRAHVVAKETAQSSDELGAVMAEAFHETGNVEFMFNSIDQVAKVATATKEPIETLGRVANQVQKQFGVAGENMGSALTTAFSAANRGGLTLDEMSEKLGLIGANAKEAGLTGEAGFEKMIAIMNLSKDAMGSLRKGIPAVAGVFDTLGTKAERAKTFMKLGIDPSSVKGDITKQIEAVLAKTGGNRDKLSAAFQGPQLQLLADLGKNYAATFSATSGDVKSKTAAANAAFEDALAKAGKSAVSYADMQAEADKNMQSNGAKMQLALEELRQAFAQPEFIGAMKSLMGTMPKLAEVIAKVVGFAAEHPVAAGTLALGGVAGQGFASSAVSGFMAAAFAKGGTSAAEKIAEGVAKGGATASSSIGASLLLQAAPFALAFGAAVVAGGYLRRMYDEHEEKVDEEGKDRVDQGKLGGKERVEGEGVFNPETGEFERYARDKEGQFKFKSAPTANAVTGGLSGIGDFAAKWSAEQNDPDSPTNKAKRAFIAPDGKAPKPTAHPKSAEDAALLARMLATTKLRVEVTNPEAIGVPGGGGGTGSPTPGRVPRP